MRARIFFLKILLSVVRIFLLKAKIFGEPYKKALVGRVRVLLARPLYNLKYKDSLEKREV